jgi:TetR/AcrR family transcriptional regulator, mexJK operon transcriptional repressor
MPTPAISKQQVLAALTAATHARNEPGPGRGEDEDGLAGLSMDQLAVAAGVSRATLYRLFGSQHNLLQALGCTPPPTVRSRILDTARELVGRHGLAELSMDDLAAAAGVSRATLYRLFPGKEALFAALIRSFSPFEPIAAVLEATGDGPPAEVIPAVAHAMAAAMDGHLGLLLQLLFELSRDRHLDPDGGHGTSEGAVQGMRTLPLVSGYLAGQMAVGRLRRMDPDLAFQALAGPIVLHLLWRPVTASQVDGPPAGGAPLEEVVDELARVWLRAMATDQQAGPEPAASTPPPPSKNRDHRPDPAQPP